MDRIMAKMRTARALKNAVPAAADMVFDLGDQVLVWREKFINHCIGELLGLFTVISINPDKKLVYVQDTKVGSARPFNITQVKRYHKPLDIARSLFSDIQRGLAYISLNKTMTMTHT